MAQIAGGIASAYVIPDQGPSATVAASAVDSTNNIVYVGGNFRYVGYAGFGRTFDINTGTASAQIPYINNNVNVVIPDGNGGWYIGGTFTYVGSTARNRLARIDSGGNLTSWNPNVNGTVTSLLLDGNIIYVGGDFTDVGGTTRNKIAAIHTDGTLQDWNPNVSSAGTQVNDIIKDGDIIYLGGTFTQVGGATTRNRLAAFHTDGTLQSWDPNVSGTVSFMVTDGTDIYFGGSFSGANSVNGTTTRNRLAAVGKSTGTVTAWDPNANDNVKSMFIDGTNIYIGGQFSTIGGTTRNALALVNTSGVLQSWNPNVTTLGGDVFSITLNNSIIYATGTFGTVGGSSRLGFAAIHTDGTLQNVTINVLSNNVPNGRAMSVQNNTLFIGCTAVSTPTGIGGVTRNFLAAFNLSDGSLTSWNPNANNDVFAMFIDGTNIYVGGQFTTIGGTTRNRAAVINTSGVLQSWNPNVANAVNIMVKSGDIIYMGGTFTTAGATTRNRLAAFHTDGTLQSWDPNVSGQVNGLVTDGTTWWFGGSFSGANSVNGTTTRNRLAAVDSTGTVTAWNPNISSTVTSLLLDGSNIYFGGSFNGANSVNGSTTRNRIAAVDKSTGTVTSWNPNSNATVYSIITDGTNFYLYGTFTSVASTTCNGLMAVDNSTGARATGWSATAALLSTNSKGTPHPTTIGYIPIFLYNSKLYSFNQKWYSKQTPWVILNTSDGTAAN